MKLILVVALAAGLSTQSAQKPETPAKCHMHEAHAQMEERGGKGMGFSQTATTHHFVIKPDGGIIDVSLKGGATRQTAMASERISGISQRCFQRATSTFRCSFTAPSRREFRK